MKIALFGGTGFIGKEIAELLRQYGHNYFEISRNATSKGSYKADITVNNSLNHIEEQADVAIICSSTLPKASYTDADVSLFVSVNITGIHNILKWSRERGVSRIIYCSTLSMVPASIKRPDEEELIDIGSHYLYKVTKSAGEHLVIGFCKLHHLQYFVLRIASVYGRGMKKDIIDLIAGKIKRAEKFVINDTAFTVDFIHVKEVAKTILACLSNANANRIINVASGKRVNLQELAEFISSILGKKVDLEIKSGAIIPERNYSIESMKNLIGHDLISLEAGLKDLLTENHP